MLSLSVLNAYKILGKPDLFYVIDTIDVNTLPLGIFRAMQSRVEAYRDTNSPMFLGAADVAKKKGKNDLMGA